MREENMMEIGQEARSMDVEYRFWQMAGNISELM